MGFAFFILCVGNLPLDLEIIDKENRSRCGIKSIKKSEIGSDACLLSERSEIGSYLLCLLSSFLRQSDDQTIWNRLPNRLLRSRREAKHEPEARKSMNKVEYKD